MKNTITLFASIVLLNTHSFAQPVIVDGTNLVAAGYSSAIKNGPATIPPGAGGAAVTWNLGALGLSDVGTYVIENPASTPVAGTYSSGNYALSVTPTGSSALYSYYIVTGGAMQELANSVTTTAGVGRNYTPGPRKILKFPFNYLDTFTAPYATATYTGYDFFQYDGYGTLITPWATYTNVVRVKDTYSSGVGYAINWYTTSPLLNVLSYDSNSNSYTGLSNVPTGVSAVTVPLSSVIISPNPFTIQTTIKIDGTADLKDATIVVTDVAGKVVSKMPLSSREVVFKREGISAGMYFYSIFNNSNSIAHGKLIIE